MHRDSFDECAEVLAKTKEICAEPLGRLVAPDEIAHAVYYLATEGSVYCGEVLSPNAGAVI